MQHPSPKGAKQKKSTAAKPKNTFSDFPDSSPSVGSDELDVASVGSLGALLRASTIDEDAAS